MFRHARSVCVKMEAGIAPGLPDDYRRNRSGIAPFLGFRIGSGYFGFDGFIQTGVPMRHPFLNGLIKPLQGVSKLGVAAVLPLGLR